MNFAVPIMRKIQTGLGITNEEEKANPHIFIVGNDWLRIREKLTNNDYNVAIMRNRPNTIKISQRNHLLSKSFDENKNLWTEERATNYVENFTISTFAYLKNTYDNIVQEKAKQIKEIFDNNEGAGATNEKELFVYSTSDEIRNIPFFSLELTSEIVRYDFDLSIQYCEKTTKTYAPVSFTLHKKVKVD